MSATSNAPGVAKGRGRRGGRKRGADDDDDSDDDDEPSAKRQATDEAKEAAAAEGSGVEQQPPNKILFVQNLAAVVTAAMLEVAFKQFEGFSSVSMVPGQTGVAFVEFGDEVQSAVAMNALQGFEASAGKPMQITFAKLG